MKRLKIKGITGMPLFLTRFQGYLDGKCGAVVWRDDGWHSHYIENKRAIYDAFVHKLYTNLENQTSALRMESAELVVEHETVKKKLSQPEAAAEGVTIAILARNTGRISAERNRLKARLQEIELRLSAIDEILIHAVSEVAGKHREATALTGQRVQSYLHGASIAAHTTKFNTSIDILHSFEEEKEFESRHSLNETLRRAVMEQSLKEVIEK